MQITVYTRSECQPCRATKRKLVKEGLTYREVDITLDDHAQGVLRSEGFRELPVVYVEYDDVLDSAWSGYRPDLIERVAKEARP